ncbi:DNA damage-binding protein 1 [Abortiporus biennis]
MRVVTTFHSPSSIVASTSCSLTPDGEHLVVAKASSLQVYEVTQDGLTHLCDLPVWGRVLSLRTLTVKKGVEKLLVLTDHPDPRLILLAFKDSDLGPELITDGVVSLHDRNATHTEFSTDFVLHPSARLAAINCYKGKLKIVLFKKGLIDEHFDVSIPELNILGIAFLPTKDPSLAILHIDHQQRTQLISRDLDVSAQELSPALSTVLPNTVLTGSAVPITDTPPIILPIPSITTDEAEESGSNVFQGGILVLGGRRIYFFDLADEDRQRRRKGKQKRLEKRKASDATESSNAVEKEKERESRKLKPKSSVKWPWSEIVSHCLIDSTGRKLLLGDKYGKMCLLTLGEHPSMILIPLGEASSATSLSYLGSQVVHVGSHYGDSQLIRIHPEAFSNIDADTLPIPTGIHTIEPNSLQNWNDEDDEDKREGDKGVIVKTIGNHIEVLEVFNNIAPIVDAITADMDGSGLPQIITCSGGNNTGSLNIVRTGADFNQLALIKGLTDVVGMWPIRASYSSKIDTHLLVSTTRNSHLFFFNGHNTVQHVDASVTAFDISVPTLTLNNIARRVVTNNAGRTSSSYADSPWVVQVTSKGANLLEFDQTLNAFHIIGEGWTPRRKELDAGWNSREIVAASANASQIVIALSGGRLALLNVGEDGTFNLVKYKDFKDDEGHTKEICSVSCQPFDSSKHFAMYIAVAFWGTNTISILSLEKSETYMSPICSTPSLPSLPSSIALHNFGSGRRSKDPEFHPYLVAGCVDGTVVSFPFVPSSGELKDKKVFGLGHTPVKLCVCHVDDKRVVLGIGDRSAIFYWDKRRVKQSPVMLQNVQLGSDINTNTFANSLLLATDEGLAIGKIRGIDKMQIRTIPLGYDNPRRISYHESANVFGVACLQVTPSRVGEGEVSHSTFTLFEGSSFNRIGYFSCDNDEQITAVHALKPVASANNEHLDLAFCVGTVRFQHGEREPSQGRLLILNRDPPDDASTPSNGKLRMMASLPTLGCVFAIDSLGDKIVAAVNSSVNLYQLQTSISSSSTGLEEVAQWNHNYFVTSLVTNGDSVTIGDAVSSISVLKVDGKKIKTVARDYGPLWPVSIGAADNGVVGCNIDCNIFAFTYDPTQVKPTLERNGSYHLGDIVTKFIPGGLSSSKDQDIGIFSPEHVFFTSSGRVGAIIHVDDEIALQLTALQHNMEKEITGPGETKHSTWRTPVNWRGRTDAEESFGFLDGDFLEQFLMHADPATLLQGENEAERIDVEPSQLQNVLEMLQSLH